jgi:hypothetical protein
VGGTLVWPSLTASPSWPDHPPGARPSRPTLVNRRVDQ